MNKLNKMPDRTTSEWERAKKKNPIPDKKQWIDWFQYIDTDDDDDHMMTRWFDHQ